jgi:ATP-binding cassette subfamily C protein CydCD
MSVGALVTSWLILPASVGVTAAVVAASLVLAPMLALAADRASEVDRQRMRSGVLRRLAGLLEAADDLRSNSVDGIVRADLAATDQRIGHASRRTAASRGLGGVVVILAGCLGAMAMLLTVGSAVVAGELIVEVGAVLVLLPVALIEPFAGAVAAIQQWPTLAAALVRTGELDGPGNLGPAGTARLDAPVESLELESVEATWPGAGYAVFSDASARATPGRWLVVDGPSGSGKSTLLSLLLGSFAPSAGVVRVNGVDASELASDELRRHVVWCPQDSHLFDSTVRANLLLGRARYDAPSEAELVEAMTTAGLGRLLETLPAGLDTRIGSEGSHLSGGERQRLAVARTLLSRAEIVLLDEPTAHLDESTAEQLMADLRRAFADRIVVLVTHHADELLAGDQSLSLGSRDHAAA